MSNTTSEHVRHLPAIIICPVKVSLIVRPRQNAAESLCHTVPNCLIPELGNEATKLCPSVHWSTHLLFRADSAALVRTLHATSISTCHEEICVTLNLAEECLYSVMIKHMGVFIL